MTYTRRAVSPCIVTESGWPNGGDSYGSLIEPVTMGSGGGSSHCYDPYMAHNSGGRGGGAVRLTITGELELACTTNTRVCVCVCVG
jgi:hypothetical protein